MSGLSDGSLHTPVESLTPDLLKDFLIKEGIPEEYCQILKGSNYICNFIYDCCTTSTYIIIIPYSELFPW